MVNINIEELIPHRDRLKLVDEVLIVNDDITVTASTVTKKWPLFENNAVNPIILIELVAQTIGIGAGYKKRKKTGKGASGWLVGIKKVDFFIENIQIGARLISSSKPLYEHDNYAVFEGSVKAGEDILCEIKLQVYSPDS